MEERQQSQRLMDYELMMDIFNRVPADARPGGKYGLIAGFGYAGDYPIKGDVTTPRQFGQQTPEMLRYGEAPAYSSGGRRVAGFYLPPDFDVSANRVMQSKTLFPMGTPQSDEVYYQDIMQPERLGVKNTPDTTIMHEFYHRGVNKLPLDELIAFAKDKGDIDSSFVFKQMQKPAGEHFLLDAIDAFIDSDGDESELPSYIRSKLSRIKKANDVIREYMTPERQEELGLRIPLKESEPKEKGILNKLLGKAQGGGVQSLAPMAKNMYRGYDDVKRGVASYIPYMK